MNGAAGPDGKHGGGCNGPRPSDASSVHGRLEAAILGLLARVRPGGSICPSEAARACAGDGDWRPLMGPVREAARRLQRAGRLLVTQKGRAVDPDEAKGAIRLRLPD
jgi:hypothetical protein